jgi:hypothetical protein
MRLWIGYLTTEYIFPYEGTVLEILWSKVKEEATKYNSISMEILQSLQRLSLPFCVSPSLSLNPVMECFPVPPGA